MLNPFGAVWNYLAAQGMGRALRHADYRLFCITHWFSAVGFWVQRVSVGWLTWELTHSGAWLGIIAAMEAVPTFIITPVAGAVADRMDRLRMFRNMVMVNMVMSGILAALTFSGHITIYMIAAIVAINGSGLVERTAARPLESFEEQVRPLVLTVQRGDRLKLVPVSAEGQTTP